MRASRCVSRPLMRITGNGRKVRRRAVGRGAAPGCGSGCCVTGAAGDAGGVGTGAEGAPGVGGVVGAAESTTAVGADRFCAGLLSYDHIARTRRVLPTSAAGGHTQRRSRPGCPGTAAPDAEQRNHAHSTVAGGSFSLFALAVSVAPSWATPVMTGSPCILGAGAGAAQAAPGPSRVAQQSPSTAERLPCARPTRPLGPTIWTQSFGVAASASTAIGPVVRDLTAHRCGVIDAFSPGQVEPLGDLGRRRRLLWRACRRGLRRGRDRRAPEWGRA